MDSWTDARWSLSVAKWDINRQIENFGPSYNAFFHILASSLLFLAFISRIRMRFFISDFERGPFLVDWYQFWEKIQNFHIFLWNFLCTSMHQMRKTLFQKSKVTHPNFQKKILAWAENPLFLSIYLSILPCFLLKMLFFCLYTVLFSDSFGLVHDSINM